MSEEDLAQTEPDGKPKNVTKSDQNLFEDSFFESFAEIDDDLENLDFSKLGEETKDDISDFEKLPVVPKVAKKTKETPPKEKLSTESLKTTEVPLKKKEENVSNKKLESLGLSDDDPTAKQMAELWDHMSTPDASEYKLMVLRLEPAVIKGTKISGYLETFHLPTTIPDIIEQIGQKYGGGKYQIRIVDGTGKYVKSKIFEISGLPKLYQDQPATPSTPVSTPPSENGTSASVTNKKVTDEEEDTEEDTWDEEDDFDPTPPRRVLRPRPPPIYDPYPPTTFPRIGRQIDSVSKDEVEKIEEKIVNKIESKFDKLLNAVSPPKQDNGLFSPEMVKHLAPIFVSWMDSKGTKDNTYATQLSEMNSRVVDLMRGMQDLVRMQDKAKDEIAEKERREREVSRREMLDHQQKVEERMLTQQAQAEDRFQKMMLQMKETLDSKHQSEMSLEQKMRLEFERQREEFRLREEKAREETKLREEKLREEARLREEEARRREFEFREQMRNEERRWQEESRRRDEELRQAEMRWREELRQKEIQALTEAKTKELEIMERIRAVENQKTDVERRLLEQFYSHNSNTKESQLQMELAIAKMSSDSESKMFQQQAQMELEKMRHATQMQMTKMKHDLEAIERKPSDDDPLDSALQNYLKRKLQIDMIKELNMDIDEGDVPGNSLKDTLGPLLKGGLHTILEEIIGPALRGGQSRQAPMPQMPDAGRVVNPGPVKVTPQAKGEAKQQNQTTEQSKEEPAKNQEPQEIDPMAEVARVAEFFVYLKSAIENKTATPEEAAVEAEDKLSPQIIEYLSQVEDSSVIINELHPLLVAHDKELADFFSKPETVTWLNEMLQYIGTEEEESSDEEESESDEKEEQSKE